MSKNTVNTSRTLKPNLFAFDITDDTLTEYLERISKSLEEHKLTLNYGFAEEITKHNGVIASRMSQTFNPYLYLTGADTGYWEHQLEEGLSTIEILYTGKDINDALGHDLPEGIWWEFAKDPGTPPKKRTLERDYAYFQETGDDDVAKPYMARHKHAVSRGLNAVSQKELKKVDEYLDCIMQEKWLATIPTFMLGYKR